MNPLLLIVKVFRWTIVPWFFPHRVFHVKILVLICVIICIIFGHCLILVLLHKEGKELGLVNFIPLNWCPVVPSFPNTEKPACNNRSKIPFPKIDYVSCSLTSLSIIFAIKLFNSEASYPIFERFKGKSISLLCHSFIVLFLRRS